MPDREKFFPSAKFLCDANLRPDNFEKLYTSSIETPDVFWKEQAARLDWSKSYSHVSESSFDSNAFGIKWFSDGELNACYNCIDRHLDDRGHKPAFIFEGDEPGSNKSVTYFEAHAEICRFANVLKNLGVKKGDRVTIYLPMILEAAFAMLACARIGAIHSVVFGGFSPQSLAGRILDCNSNFLITADEGSRGGRRVPLKTNADEACDLANGSVKSVLVVRRSGGPVEMRPGRDVWLHDVIESVAPECPAEPMNAEDPLFILYTSGSTGKPKGVMHTTGGYLVWAAMTHEYAFDLKDDDVFWCTADVGWITGHTYVVYGPMLNGTTSLIYEGVPTYPDASRLWSICDTHKVSIFYTAPTALRALMSEGEEPVLVTDRQSLRILGTVGEPINPEVWKWYYYAIGRGNCPIVDTWWQTETGGAMILPIPGLDAMKPGAAGRPFFGVELAILDVDGNELEGAAEGNLVVKSSWPGQMRTIYGDHDRFFDTYFTTYPGYYFTGDGCRRDKDGTYWITGRVDDVINVSGHRMGTAEIESSLVAHESIAEAAVVGYPHPVKGQGIYAYVVPHADVEFEESLRNKLIQHVRKTIGPIASPDIIQCSHGLPKTRSGKVMRRILRKVAENNFEDLGDTSTLLEPSIVEELITQRKELLKE